MFLFPLLLLLTDLSTNCCLHHGACATAKPCMGRSAPVHCLGSKKGTLNSFQSSTEVSGKSGRTATIIGQHDLCALPELAFYFLADRLRNSLDKR
jgi:hypothetical protein